jgi:hypothetical protein
MRFGGLLVALVLAVGVAGTVVALHSREANTEFVSQQKSLTPVEAGALERLILTTSDPRPGYGGRARAAHCVSVSNGALGNPWSCLVRYPRTPEVRYSVTVHADGSIYGLDRPAGSSPRGVLTVRGCCVVAGS